MKGPKKGAAADKPALASWPVPRKANWIDYVNTPQTEAKLAAIRRSVERGSPFGGEAWTTRTHLALCLPKALALQALRLRDSASFFRRVARILSSG